MEDEKLSDLEKDLQEYNATFNKDGSINSMNDKGLEALFSYFQGEGIGCPISIIEMSELPDYLDNDMEECIKRMATATDVRENRFRPGKDYVLDTGTVLISFNEDEKIVAMYAVCQGDERINREVMKKALETYGDI